MVGAHLGKRPHLGRGDRAGGLGSSPGQAVWQVQAGPCGLGPQQAGWGSREPQGREPFPPFTCAHTTRSVMSPPICRASETAGTDRPEETQGGQAGQSLSMHLSTGVFYHHFPPVSLAEPMTGKAQLPLAGLSSWLTLCKWCWGLRAGPDPTSGPPSLLEGLLESGLRVPELPAAGRAVAGPSSKVRGGAGTVPPMVMLAGLCGRLSGQRRKQAQTNEEIVSRSRSAAGTKRSQGTLRSGLGAPS